LDLDRLLSKASVLIEHMRDDGHSESYVRQVSTEINWLRGNGCRYDSYESACRARESQTESGEMRRRYRLMYGILRRFDEDDVLPDFRPKEPLFRRGAYHQLDPRFRSVVDAFVADGKARGLKDKTIRGYASAGSLFLLAMQKRGRGSLEDVTEEDVLSFFAGESGGPACSSGFEKEVVSVLKSDLGAVSEVARRVATYVPRIRPRRNNIQYLQPEEVDAVRDALGDDESGLSLRDRAIGTLLLLTGLRACDIVGLTMGDISWERDEIRVVQEKTGSPLALPMSAAVGNALFDYLAEGRPRSGDPHVFLGLARPHDPISACAVWHVASRIYDAAGIRTEGGRRGTHLFRHNVATSMVGAGTPRPVASAVLGHGDPNSLDHYLSADIAHLRECALDVGRFPVRKGAFDI